MISIEIREKDLNELTRTEVINLPGTFFAGTSPLLRPFMKKLEALLPPENKGRGDSYVLCALHSHIDQVHADESQIAVKSGEKEVMIRREELGELIGERYPTTSHHRLNLPGLLFLQSGPALQTASAIILRRVHKLHIPDGCRTMRYIFHMSVAAIDADKEKVVIVFDMERLPKKEDGSSVLD
ncbi:MAG: hypothetical protein JW999_05265 [Methanotrichaceae archaeon]|nr:hypothetical protein [Methanotrichaceae archaeon]